MTTITQRSSPFTFATTTPYQGLRKDLGQSLMALADSPTSTDWERCLAHFLRSIYGLSGSFASLNIYSLHLHYFLSSSARGGPPKHPEDYTRDDVEDFIHQSVRSTRSRGLAPSISTVNQRLMPISAFYRFAATYYLSSPGDGGRLTPLLGVPSPTLGMRFGKPRRTRRALSYEEMERFFDAIPTDTVRGLRDRAVYLLYFWTARRRSEIARLTWGDIEYGTLMDEEGHVHSGWLYHFTGKGKGGEDDIAELPVEAKNILDRYLQASGRAATMRPEDPLFLAIGPYASRGRPLTGQAMSVALKKYAAAAGLDTRRLSLHSWRHTATYQRYKAGQSLRSLQRLLRHLSIETTNIYLEDLIGTADPTAKVLEERFARFSRP